jgi:hypothetical protein
VRDEDYATGKRIQRTLKTGSSGDVLFGRNEYGGQRFHRWVDAVLETDDAELDALFAEGIDRAPSRRRSAARFRRALQI